VPELVELAGGRAVAATTGEPSRRHPWRELAALAPAPDLVVIALCGFDVARAHTELAAVSDPDALPVLGGGLGARVEFLDGNAYTSRPGPRLVDAAELLARLIAC
jgi:iron complex transport system substrate-binding protein